MILDGRPVVHKMKEELRQTIDSITGTGVRQPRLQVIMVGENPASRKYVSMKEKACRELSIDIEVQNFAEDADIEAIKLFIRDCNKYDAIDGIIVQLPLPAGYSSREVRDILDTISPDKDVDGLTTLNSGKLYNNVQGFLPCTPLGISHLINYYDIPTAGKNVVIVGRGDLVGKPLAHIMSSKGYDATVTLCHSKTENLHKITKNADILVTAVGIPYLIKESMVSKHATVIDAGSGVGLKGKICGDVDFENVYRKVKNITPVPGGVGPLTVAMLLSNTVFAWLNNIKAHTLE